MPRNEKDVDSEKTSAFESELYEAVRDFFMMKKKCEKTGSAISRPVSLKIFGGTIFPDAFGISAPSTNEFKIYMAEGKASFRGRSFDQCKGQAISLQRFADYVYVFFPAPAWEELTKEEQNEIAEECIRLKLGLLTIDKDKCHEKLKPNPNTDILKQEKRQIARDRIVQYFPDFEKSEVNARFFENYPSLADNIVQESFGLLDEHLVRSFTRITKVKKQSIKPFCEWDTFEFYLRSPQKKGIIYLRIKPFGSDDFATKIPTLLIEEQFKRSLLKKNDTRQKLTRHIDVSLRSKCRITTREWATYSPDTVKKVLRLIEQSQHDDFSILKSLGILGIEKEEIKKRVQASLETSMNFMDSLKSA